ncbi:DHH family phosphoesterase [Chakrabartyella piscis]|uniref:DHH family phosphoesterase n=1 Tax=Chakrabartyella piscis TaxID=2918914 RepID=UPI0029587A2C|nr:DHH family phosphoesterase [Chakrabartyella piscis]
MKNGTKNDNGIVVIAVIVLIICGCFMMNLYLGIGAVVGAGTVFGAYFGMKKMQLIQGEGKEQKPSFLDTDVLQQNFQIPQNLPVPYAVLDMRGHVLMSNEKFMALFADQEEANVVLDSLLRQTLAGEETSLVTIGERIFEGCIENCDVVDPTGAVGMARTATLLDVTETHHLQDKLERQEPVVAMIVLDNYDEVAGGLDGNSLPILSALLERTLTQNIQESGGIIRKLEKDRYFALMNKEKMLVMKEHKFEITNVIREISVSNEQRPVTMSMGIGIGGGSMEEAMKNANAAIDLALGRGGDQVLIKDGENYTFFGGKTGEVGRNSRIRARVKADALWELMEESSGILVMGHKHADLDSIGSCMGICAIARGMDKKCSIVMNEVSGGIRKLWDNVQASNVAHQTPLIKPQDAIKSMDDKTLLIVVDTHRKWIVESPEVLEHAKRVVVFDHHRKSPDGIEGAVLVYHEAYASSTSELITEMIQYMGKRVKLSPMEADALLSGITLDTKNFGIKTGAITFEVSAYLRRNGADGVRVRMLFKEDMETYKAKANAIAVVEVFQGNIAISECECDVDNIIVATAQTADELMNITGIHASFVCCKIGNTVNVSARSFGDVNVQRIMERLGGGGHLTVSGGQFPDETIDEVKAKIRQAIKEYFEEEM